MSAELNAIAALARHESQNAGDPFHFSLTNHLYVALRDLLASRVSTPPSEHPAHSGHEFGGAYARSAALSAGDPDWMNATGGTPPTDEDEREALAKTLTGLTDREWTIATAEGVDHLSVYFDAADRILAAGFRRQAVPTPEPATVETQWAYHDGDTWIWSKGVDERRARSVAKFLGTSAAKRTVTYGPWESVPTEGEA